MVAGKGGGGGGGANILQTTTSECCMCGDYGLSQELFRCKICKFRSQHKYCSNQYPKAESYEACNWCLAQKHDSGNSSNSSSSFKNSSGDDRRHHDVKNKRNPNDKIGHGGFRERRRAFVMNTTPIKKLNGSSAEEESPVSATGGKRVGDGEGVGVEGRNRVALRKSKSANQLSNGWIKTRQVVRNKVRRYKLLEDVSS